MDNLFIIVDDASCPRDVPPKGIEHPSLTHKRILHINHNHRGPMQIYFNGFRFRIYGC